MANCPKSSDIVMNTNLRVVLHDMVQEIAAGVSYEKFNNILHERKDTEVYSHLQQQMINKINSDIDYAFEVFGIEEKRNEIIKLVAKNSNNQTAWRPTTGHIDITSIEGQTLSKYKQNLLDQIAEFNNRKNNHKMEIEKKRQAFQQQMKFIKNINING